MQVPVFFQYKYQYHEGSQPLVMCHIATAHGQCTTWLNAGEHSPSVDLWLLTWEDMENTFGFAHRPHSTYSLYSSHKK